MPVVNTDCEMPSNTLDNGVVGKTKGVEVVGSNLTVYP